MPENDVDPNAAAPLKPGRHMMEATRKARLALAAKRAQPDTFGAPEVFAVIVGGKAFTWELRRFGGIVLQRSAEVFSDAASAREAGERALTAVLATPGLPVFKREQQQR